MSFFWESRTRGWSCTRERNWECRGTAVQINDRMTESDDDDEEEEGEVECVDLHFRCLLEKIDTESTRKSSVKDL